MGTFNRRIDQLTKDAIRESLDEIAAVFARRFGDFVGEAELGWLVEMNKEHPDAQARWWHPRDGWVFTAENALRFARQKDALDYIAATHCIGHATEHMFIGPSA